MPEDVPVLDEDEWVPGNNVGETLQG